MGMWKKKFTISKERLLYLANNNSIEFPISSESDFVGLAVDLNFENKTSFINDDNYITLVIWREHLIIRYFWNSSKYEEEEVV